MTLTLGRVGNGDNQHQLHDPLISLAFKFHLQGVFLFYLLMETIKNLDNYLSQNSIKFSDKYLKAVFLCSFYLLFQFDPIPWASMRQALLIFEEGIQVLLDSFQS